MPLTEIGRLGVESKKQRNMNAFGRVTENLLRGYMTGQALHAQQKKDRLDGYIKMVDLEEKMTKLQGERQNQRILGNLAKSAGLLEMDPGEESSARSAGFDAIGKDVTSGDPSTRSGKLSNLFDQLEVGSITVNGGTPSIHFQKKGAGKASDDKTKKARILEAARDAAQREWEASQRETALPGQTTFGKAPMDLVQKYIPAMTAYEDGDTARYESELQKMTDPWGAMDGDLDLGK